MRKLGALHTHQKIDRHTLRMFWQGCERVDKSDAIAFVFSHANDPAAADMNARLAEMSESLKAIIVSPGGDDLAVVLGRRIEIMIVVVEARRLESLGLVSCEHAQRDAGLHTKRLNGLDHLTDAVEVLVLGRAPRGAHAEPRRSGVTRGLGLRNDIGKVHELGGLEAGFVERALRTIAAIFRTASGLDRQQRGNLD